MIKIKKILRGFSTTYIPKYFKGLKFRIINKFKKNGKQDL